MISQKLSALTYIADITGFGLRISKRDRKDFMASNFQFKAGVMKYSL